MISKILLTGLMTFFLSGGIVTITENVNDCEEATAIEYQGLTKAIEFNGEVIPMIELPTVEITGKLNTDDLVEAIVVDGVIYPSIELEAVLITPGA